MNPANFFISPGSCPSMARKIKRYEGRGPAMKALTAERCSIGQSLCGTSIGRKGNDDWECVDTQSSLESCEIS